MRTVLVTGAGGFIGRHLVLRLRERGDVRVLAFTRQDPPEVLAAHVGAADTIFHLAGVNRPETQDEFRIGNVELTTRILDLLERGGRDRHLIVTSSVQAAQENPYGLSKRAAEDAVAAYVQRTGSPATVFRLRNVFGKWCRPEYNSVVATFCHNIAHGLPIMIRDPGYALELVHVDDVVDCLVQAMERRAPLAAGPVDDGIPFHRITLGELGARLHSYAEESRTLRLPDLSDRFARQLYTTFISYLPVERWSYALDRKVDARGDLAEFLKSPVTGQVFVSRTAPGVTRGNHYHHTKVEKFLVIAGTGLIRLQQIEGADGAEFKVRGEEYRVVQIPPGYAHSITNVGEEEMITLFWSSEILDLSRPDTVARELRAPMLEA